MSVVAYAKCNICNKLFRTQSAKSRTIYSVLRHWRIEYAGGKCDLKAPTSCLWDEVVSGRLVLEDYRTRERYHLFEAYTSKVDSDGNPLPGPCFGPGPDLQTPRGTKLNRPPKPILPPPPDLKRPVIGKKYLSGDTSTSPAPKKRTPKKDATRPSRVAKPASTRSSKRRTSTSSSLPSSSTQEIYTTAETTTETTTEKTISPQTNKPETTKQHVQETAELSEVSREYVRFCNAESLLRNLDVLRKTPKLELYTRLVDLGVIVKSDSGVVTHYDIIAGLSKFFWVVMRDIIKYKDKIVKNGDFTEKQIHEELVSLVLSSDYFVDF